MCAAFNYSYNIYFNLQENAAVVETATIGTAMVITLDIKEVGQIITIATVIRFEIFTIKKLNSIKKK